jgi:predicted TIM-barrel fold metal-dependent hydrolase
MTGANDKIWINSADDHLTEPADIWVQAGLSERSMKLAPYSKIENDRESYYCEGKEIFRVPMAMSEALHPPGADDLRLRMNDLDKEGIWASVSFPSVGIWTTAMTDRAAHLECVQAYNDWCASEVMAVSPRLIPAGVIPLLDFNDALKETERLLQKGFQTVFLPTTLPRDLGYNDERWEPLWSLIEEAGVPISFHIGTGPMPKIQARGAGGAVINYFDTCVPAQRTVAHLVASGALDRHPRLRVLVAEGGCSWIPALVDRLTEAYRQHHAFVRPKLNREIKEIVYSQVFTSFQNDESAIPAIEGMGYRNVLWGCDYPHLEGTFPNTQETLRRILDGVPADIQRLVTQENFYALFPQAPRCPDMRAAA